MNRRYLNISFDKLGNSIHSIINSFTYEAMLNKIIFLFNAKKIVKLIKMNFIANNLELLL